MPRYSLGRLRSRLVGERMQPLIPRPCLGCGRPVVWMAMHRECWRKEKRIERMLQEKQSKTESFQK